MINIEPAALSTHTLYSLPIFGKNKLDIFFLSMSLLSSSRSSFSLNEFGLLFAYFGFFANFHPFNIETERAEHPYRKFEKYLWLINNDDDNNNNSIQ